MITMVEFMRPVPIHGDPVPRVKYLRKQPYPGDWSAGDIDICWGTNGQAVSISWHTGKKWPLEWVGVVVPLVNIAFVLDDGQ